MNHHAIPVNVPQTCLVEATTVTVEGVKYKIVAVAVAVAITHNNTRS
jgi:hypothetical protein